MNCFARALNRCAPTIPAMHCPNPSGMLSRFASKTSSTGAKMTDCCGARHIRKSHHPFNPAGGSALNSAPPIRQIDPLYRDHTSASTGPTIHTARENSVCAVAPSSIPRGSAAVSAGRAATGAVVAKRLTGDPRVSPKSCNTAGYLKSLNAMFMSSRGCRHCTTSRVNL